MPTKEPTQVRSVSVDADGIFANDILPMEMLPKFLSMIVSIYRHANQGAKASTVSVDADDMFVNDISPMKMLLSFPSRIVPIICHANQGANTSTFCQCRC